MKLVNGGHLPAYRRIGDANLYPSVIHICSMRFQHLICQIELKLNFVPVTKRDLQLFVAILAHDHMCIQQRARPMRRIVRA